MIWIKQRDISNIMNMFNRAAEAGDALVAGELFDTLVQIASTSQEHMKDKKTLDAMQWKRISELTMKEIEGILSNPMMDLKTQLILGRKVMPIVGQAEQESVDYSEYVNNQL